MKYKDLKPDKKVGNYAWNHQAHLGSGAFGKVYLGRDLTSNQFVAIKTMNNDQISDPYMQEALQKEIKVMQTLKGNNVVRLLDVFKSASHTYLIQEFCNGGDFRSYLTKKSKLPEAEARKVLNDFLTGFQEMVKNGLIHRDLKPENMLMHDGSVKIADFGFATHVDNFKNQMLKTCVGTPLYMSPQILSHQPYTTKSDVWSTGLIYYEMLCGKTPWPARDQLDLINNIARMPLKYPFNIQISEISKDFIRGCLEKDEKNRFSWDQVLSHKIFTPQGQEAAQLKKKPTVQLDKRSLDVLTELQEIVQKHNVDLDKVFKNFDKSGDQSLDINEFTKMIQVINNTLKADEVQEIFKRFDSDNSGSISLKEFKVLILDNDYKQVSDNELLANYRGDKLFIHLINVIYDNHIDIHRIFNSLGQGANKVLDVNQFKLFVQKIDDQINDNDAKYIFRKFDKDRSGSISLEEFISTVEIESKKLASQSNQNVPQPQPLSPSKKASPNAQKIIFELKNIINTNGLDLGMIFQSFDLSGDSSLDFGEFKKLIEVINARYSEQEVKDVFKVFDVNGDGDISFKEFQAVLK